MSLPPLAIAAIAIAIWSGVAAAEWPMDTREPVMPSHFLSGMSCPRDSPGSNTPVQIGRAHV